MIEKKEGFYRQKDGQKETHKTFYSLYQPVSTKPKATLLILHGMKEHSGRYDEVAGFFAEKGFVVLTYDHLGHGKTATNDAELGFVKEKQPAKQLIADARVMQNFLEKENPGLPRFILGHSMGSFITRCLLQKESKRFDGAVIVGTGGKVSIAPITKFLLSIANFIAPRKRSGFLNNFFDNRNNQQFKNDADAGVLSWLSLSTANRAAFAADKLNGQPFSNNGFYALLSVNVRATQRNWSASIRKDLPMLFVSGQNDPIGEFGKGIQTTVKQLKKDGFENVTQKLYPEMRHEILNEEIRFEVYNDIANWLETALVKKKKS
jgi:alpha-beta hydrolase superfamily lysophospholipase